MTDMIAIEKNRIRKEVLKKRDQISETALYERSHEIAEKLFCQRKYKDAECILIYASMKSEVKTDEIIVNALQKGKQVFCPKCTDKANGQMEFVRISELSDLKEGYFGIREPEIGEDSVIYGTNDYADKAKRTLVIVPGVAFDKKGNRIGYNGGYYDRFLAKYAGLNTIALAFEEQVVSMVPTGEYDISIQSLIIG